MYSLPERTINTTGFQFRVGGKVIELVDSYKYLGVTFRSNHDFTMNAELLAKSAGRALGKIIAKMREMKDFGCKTFEKLYNSCVVPIMDYCSGVWGFKKYQSLDNVQHRGIRHYMGVHRFAPILAITGDIGWIPTNQRRWINMIRIWNRVITMDENKITKHVFNTDYSNCHNYWCSEIKDIFSKIGLVENLNNRTPVNLMIVKSAIENYYKSEWSEKLTQFSKLRTYRLFKNNFEQESYLKLNLKRNERSLLAQLRCSILPIRVETGRYVGELPEQRLC